MTRPMQEPTTLILLALVSEPRHGYGLLSEVEHLSEGRVQLRVSTMYAAIDRLQADGLITTHAEYVVNGRARREYAISDAGKTALSAEIDRMEILTRKARTRLPRAIALGGA